MGKAVKLDVSGVPVRFYISHREGPDFGWVAINDLVIATGARWTPGQALRFTRDFPAGEDLATRKDGDEIVSIISHSMAQGLSHAMDHFDGFKPKDEIDNGPHFQAYTIAAAEFANRHLDLSFPDLIAAYKRGNGAGGDL